MDSQQKISIAEKQIDPNPTEQQKLDGTYQKGSVSLLGLKIVLENSSNSYRQGVDEDGKPWKTLMNNAYGYIENTIGVDGDEIDVFLSDNFFDECLIYIIFQKNSRGIFDEHKIMLGFKNEQQAYDSYMSNYKNDWKGFLKLETMSQNQFLGWLIDKSTKTRSIESIKKPINEVSQPNFEKTKIIEIEGEIIQDVTLKSLQDQLGEESINVVVVKIASPGGNVIEGLMIMMWLNHLSKLGVYVITVVTANAYSIASLIACCADKPLISRHADIMVHDPMLPELKYVNADTLEEHTKDLRRLESEMYQLYQLFTGIDLETIKQLMKGETYINAQDAVNYGFFKEVININPRPKSMVKQTNNVLDMKSTRNVLLKVIGMVNNSNVINQMYYDDKGGELEVFQQDPSFYSTGDRASVKEGKITLSNGSILTIVDNVITDITKGVEAVVETPAVEAPTVEAVVEVPAVSADVSTNVGPTPTLEKKEEEVVAIDEKKEDPTIPMKVEAVEDAAKEAVETPIAKVEETKAKGDSPSMEGITSEQYAELSAKYDDLNTKFSQFLEEFKETSQSSLEFEDLAGKAIEALANNTVSNFKPSARVNVSAEVETGTIFSRIKKRRGL